MSNGQCSRIVFTATALCRLSVAWTENGESDTWQRC